MPTNRTLCEGTGEVMNQFKCSECEGKAGCPSASGGRDHCDECDATECKARGIGRPCPTCKGSGWMVLAVEEHGNIGSIFYTPITRYHPMSDAEVEELVQEHGTMAPTIESILGWLRDNVGVTYKGSPVRLIAKEG